MPFPPRRTCLALAVLALGACRREPQATSPVLAEGEGVRVTADDLRARANLEAALTRGELADPVRKREFLDRMVDLEVQAAEARRLGLDREPDLALTIKQLLAQRLAARRTPEPPWTPSLEELRAAWAQHAERLMQPERVQAKLVAVAGQRGSAELARAGERLERARATLMSRRGAAVSEADLAALAAPMADLGLRTREELGAQVGPRLAEAAFALPAPGGLSAVAEVPGGLGLVWVGRHEPAQPTPFEQASPALAAGLARERAAQRLQAWTQGLKAARQVQVDTRALDAVDVRSPP